MTYINYNEIKSIQEKCCRELNWLVKPMETILKKSSSFGSEFDFREAVLKFNLKLWRIRNKNDIANCSSCSSHANGLIISMVYKVEF